MSEENQTKKQKQWQKLRRAKDNKLPVEASQFFKIEELLRFD